MACSRGSWTMHELSIIRSILDIIEEYAEEYRFSKVKSMKISFGRLSRIEPQVLEFTFDIQSTGTKAEGAALEFDIKPIIIHCFSCEKDPTSRDRRRLGTGKYVPRISRKNHIH